MSTSDITKAAKSLSVVERKLDRVVSNEQAAVVRATARAQAKYVVKIKTVTDEVAAAKQLLQDLVAAA